MDQGFTTGGIRGPDKQRKQHFGKNRTTEAALGLAHVRVERQGARFSFQAKDGAAGARRLLDTQDFGAGDLLVLRFAADSGWGKPCAVDARLVDSRSRPSSSSGTRHVWAQGSRLQTQENMCSRIGTGSDGKRQSKHHYTATAERSGLLRLTRTGPRVKFWVGPEGA